MKRKLYYKSRFPVYRLFWMGILAGVLIPNIMWKAQWHQNTIASMYLLGTFAEDELNKEEYFFQVLKMRGSLYAFSVVCGVSVFGVPLAVLASVLTGLKIGLLMTLSILEFGINGGLVGAGLLFPQYLIYIPCSACLFTVVYEQSKKTWSSQPGTSGEFTSYLVYIILCGIFLLAGILTETYFNPPVTELMMNNSFLWKQ